MLYKYTEFVLTQNLFYTLFASDFICPRGQLVRLMQELSWSRGKVHWILLCCYIVITLGEIVSIEQSKIALAHVFYPKKTTTG